MNAGLCCKNTYKNTNTVHLPSIDDDHNTITIIIDVFFKCLGMDVGWMLLASCDSL